MNVKKNTDGRRWNLLIMRAKGEVTNLSISPFTLLLAFVFGLAFTAVAIVIINRYFVLYHDHQELAAIHQEAAEELNRLKNLYNYQSVLNDQYADIIGSVGQVADIGPGPAETADSASVGEAVANNGDFISLGRIGSPVEETPADALTDAEGFSLEGWASLLAEPSDPLQQNLDIERLQVHGPRFRFQLVNEGDGTRQAQGRLLMLFAVEKDNKISMVPYPQFDIKSAQPEFGVGPSYKIRSAKPISGHLDIPAGAKVLEMMVVARSQAGDIVMKKKLTPQD